MASQQQYTGPLDNGTRHVTQCSYPDACLRESRIASTPAVGQLISLRTAIGAFEEGQLAWVGAVDKDRLTIEPFTAEPTLTCAAALALLQQFGSVTPRVSEVFL